MPPKKFNRNAATRRSLISPDATGYRIMKSSIASLTCENEAMLPPGGQLHEETAYCTLTSKWRVKVPATYCSNFMNFTSRNSRAMRAKRMTLRLQSLTCADAGTKRSEIAAAKTAYPARLA